jgi:hypothetical protein
MSIVASGTPLEHLLNLVVSHDKGLLWYREKAQPTVYEIWDIESFEAAHPTFGLQTQEFELREIDPTTANYALSVDPDICEIHCRAGNSTSNTLTVRERPHVLEQIARKLREIDVKPNDQPND